MNSLLKFGSEQLDSPRIFKKKNCIWCLWNNERDIFFIETIIFFFPLGQILVRLIVETGAGKMGGVWRKGEG